LVGTNLLIIPRHVVAESIDGPREDTEAEAEDERQKQRKMPKRKMKTLRMKRRIRKKGIREGEKKVVKVEDHTHWIDMLVRINLMILGKKRAQSRERSGRKPKNLQRLQKRNRLPRAQTLPYLHRSTRIQIQSRLIRPRHIPSNHASRRAKEGGWTGGFSETLIQFLHLADRL
jgi:hypothetical protein